MTVLAPRLRKHAKGLAFAAVLSVALLVSMGLAYQQHRCGLRLPQGCVALEYASTPNQQQRGLGGRPSMATNQAMLFVMHQSAASCFWMKDMHFNLDIIWMDINKQITLIKPDLSPASYPKSYCSSQPTAYVLEMDAGTAATNHLAAGQQMRF